MLPKRQEFLTGNALGGSDGSGIKLRRWTCRNHEVVASPVWRILLKARFLMATRSHCLESASGCSLPTSPLLRPSSRFTQKV